MWKRCCAAWHPHVKLVYLCSPNNPTGNSALTPALETICKALDGKAIVVIDEAYIEWSRTPSLTRWLARFPTMAFLRTLSKAHALAGARSGALLAHPDLIELAKRVIPPYCLAQSTIEAALRALEPAELGLSGKKLDALLAEREYLAQRLRSLAVGGQGLAQRRQFSAHRLPRRGWLHENSIAGGSIVRDLRAIPPCPNRLRVSVGTRAQNDVLLAQRGGLMSGERVLFVDRDGTLNEETRTSKSTAGENPLHAGRHPALLELKRAGFVFVMVTNQDGLGTPSFPTGEIRTRRTSFIVRLLASQGIEFEAVCICPHFKRERLRLPQTEYRHGAEFLAGNTIDKTPAS
jgi:hypothetical protein